MNINIYLEDTLGSALNQYSKQIGQSRNAIIREAVKEWIAHHAVKQWPNSVLKFAGIKEVPSFESYRTDLLPPKEGPVG